MRRDTAPGADERQLAIQRRLTGAERLMIAFDMSLLARDLALAGLRRRRPDRSRSDLELDLLRSLFPSLDIPARHP